MSADPSVTSPLPAGKPAAAPAAKPARGLSMASRTVLAMLTAGLVPLVLYGALSLMQTRQAIREEAERSMQATAERMASVVDEWVDKNVRALQAVARLPAVASMSAEQQTEVMVQTAKTYPWMYLVFTVGTDGQSVARSDGKPNTSYADRQYFKDVVNMGKPLAWETLIGRTSKKPALVVSVPITVNDRVVGVMASAMAIEDISRIIAKWRSGSSGYAFLVDQTGKVVAHPKEEMVLAEASLSDHPLVASIQKSGLPRLLSFQYKGGPAALGYVQGTNLLWAVGVQQNEDEVFEPLRRSVYLGLGLLAGAAVLVALLARALANRLVKPIVDLTQVANRMSTGEIEEPLRTDRQDEIGDLTRSLERLRKSMKSAMDRLTGGAR